jgi:hypothetical protein
MPQGSEAKQRRKQARAEARNASQDVTQGSNAFTDFMSPVSTAGDGIDRNPVTLDHNDPDNFDSYIKGSDSESDGDEDVGAVSDVSSKIASGKKKRAAEKRAAEARVRRDEGGGFIAYLKGIKPLPLFFLLLMVGGSLFPAFIYLFDNAGPILAKSNVMGRVGYSLGIGATPRSRVVTFYEKHAPDNLGNVDKMMGDYYGRYPQLTKKLERKYNDYGYFLGWQDDESAYNTAMKKVEEVKTAAGVLWTNNAPKQVQGMADNFRFNVGQLYKKAEKAWRKQIWPTLQPYIGIPDEKEARKQKMKDRETYGRKKGKKGKNSYRDEEDEE